MVFLSTRRDAGGRVRPAIGDEDRATEFRSLFEDEARFRAWYDAALPTVYGFVFVRCGGVRQIAEDLTQEAFVEAVRGRDRFDGRSDPVTWICSIARHRLVDHFRRQHRDERRRLRLLTRGNEPSVSTAHEERDAVLRTLREMPPLQRAALVLHYLDDLPLNEVADVLDRSESAVESLLARGRESFRRIVSRTEEGEP
jgi:RNA polymerase sigma-70 factor (ECF subfamily)